jgi:His Kinase A (phospho-acceptor) domain
MNAIIGMTDLVLDTPVDDDQRQCLETVKSAADNLLAIINDLLDFSKIEAGKLELDPTDFALRPMLGDTLRGPGHAGSPKGAGAGLQAGAGRIGVGKATAAGSPKCPSLVAGTTECHPGLAAESLAIPVGLRSIDCDPATQPLVP